MNERAPVTRATVGIYQDRETEHYGAIVVAGDHIFDAAGSHKGLLRFALTQELLERFCLDETDIEWHDLGIASADVPELLVELGRRRAA